MSALFSTHIMDCRSCFVAFFSFIALKMDYTFATSGQRPQVSRREVKCKYTRFYIANESLKWPLPCSFSLNNQVSSFTTAAMAFKAPPRARTMLE